ncbi:hypothetical protein [Aurantiacibacter luteus]|uniref:Uncharacterized protein n=1 Tax=Aurantiacibacter luteus TaxID=1581420 RepID=A0A0G9MVA6_9SPHN|nr:hypothetical protein [Aurantiacibacter luteus]KLE34615.1 hypothetical protein AAW00_10540 [Aurantiacibacter luteus]
MTLKIIFAGVFGLLMAIATLFALKRGDMRSPEGIVYAAKDRKAGLYWTMIVVRFAVAALLLWLFFDAWSHA